MKPSEEKAPDNARLLAEYDTRVEHQTVARGSAKEPMVAKSILPTLGGTPMAWNTRLRGTEVVDLVEAEAARDDRFTWALGKIWIVAKGLPPDVVERIVIASGNAIRPA